MTDYSTVAGYKRAAREAKRNRTKYVSKYGRVLKAGEYKASNWDEGFEEEAIMRAEDRAREMTSRKRRAPKKK